ncbi:synaptic vesicle glycoprotein 2C-like isoform X2 [Teleopsis dalmanni]|nr:synaptic vesicle glycoprotein 2C-like isoform X2 [Teleopsis dalmanni]
MIISAYYVGYLSDVYGRRKVMLYSCPFHFCCSILSSFMQEYKYYLLMRVMTGFFLSGTVVPVLTYVGEFCTNYYRAEIVNYTSMFNGFGMIYYPAMAHFILHTDWRVQYAFITYRPWRLLAVTFIFPAVIGYILLLLFLPESPRFLMATNQIDKAHDALNWLAQKNKGKTLDDLNIERIVPFPVPIVKRKYIWVVDVWLDLLPIFERAPFIAQFILSCIVMFGLYFVVNGIGFWFTDLRNQSAYYKQVHLDYSEKTMCEKIESFPFRERNKEVCMEYVKHFEGAIITGACFVVGYIIMGVLLLYYKRKKIFTSALLISFLSGLSLSIGKGPWIELLCPIFFLGIPNILVNFVNSSVMDHFPTFLRNKAVSIVLMFGRFGTVAGAQVGIYIQYKWCLLAFTLFPGVILASATLSLFLML